MRAIAVVSFDLENTIVTNRFSELVWREGIPRLYAEARQMDIEEAKRAVDAEYETIGKYDVRWYDIRYWFDRFGLSNPERLLAEYIGELEYYPDALEALESLSADYEVIVVSNSSRDFLDVMLRGVSKYVSRSFSATSDFGRLKDPDFYRMVCESLGVEPSKVAHVGDDYEFDFLAASKAGLIAFHLSREGRSPCGQSAVRDLREFERAVRAIGGRGP